jgi:hypothetical protein
MMRIVYAQKKKAQEPWRLKHANPSNQNGSGHHAVGQLGRLPQGSQARRFTLLTIDQIDSIN